MEKYECFEKFRDNSECFSYPIETMDFLEGLDPIEITDKYNIRYISPLLNEIFDYALVFPGLDVYYIQGLCDDNRTILYDKAYDVTRACNYYITDLFDNGCNHPSVLRYNYISDGMSHFEIMLELLSELREFLPEEGLYVFDKSFHALDKDVMLGNGKQFLEISNNIKSIETANAFMHYIARNALDLSVRRLLLLGDNDTIEFALDSDDNLGSVLRSVSNDKTLYLIDLFSKLEEFRESDDEALVKYITDTNEEYNAYKSCQYKYLQYSYLEAKLLKKCNKM